MSFKKNVSTLGLSAMLVVSLAGCGASSSTSHKPGSSNKKSNGIMIPAKNQSTTKSSSKNSNGLMMPANNQSSTKSSSKQSNTITTNKTKRYH